MRRAIRPGEDGYILVAVMFMLAHSGHLAWRLRCRGSGKKFSAIANWKPCIAASSTFARIKMYYKKFNAYPPNVDALVKTNEIRFLRKRYIDPMTGKDDWKPILFGQNKTPMAMGFFGQPLVGGSTVSGNRAGRHRRRFADGRDAGQFDLRQWVKR